MTMSPSKVSVVHQRRSPAEVCAVASTKILRIQAVIERLGPDDAKERATLETMLTRSRQLAAVPPVEEYGAAQFTYWRMCSVFGRSNERVVDVEKIDAVHSTNLQAR